MVSPSFTENNELHTTSGRAHSIIKLFFFLLFCRDSVRIDHGEKTKNL